MRRSLIVSRRRLGCVALLAAVGVSALVWLGGAAAAGMPSNSALGWGFNAYGELGDGTSTGPGGCIGGYPCSTSPITVKLPSGTRVTAVAAGNDHALAVTSTGQVLAWGFNRYGELGDGTFTGPVGCACSTTPVKVKLPKGTRVTAVAAGDDHSLALTSTGQVLAWGGNSYGQLGDGTFTGPGTCDGEGACSTRPIMVKLPKGTKVTEVAAGFGDSVAVTSTGQVLAWGANSYGQLGDGTFAGPGTCAVFSMCSATPIMVKLPEGTRVTAVAAGYDQSLALTSTSQVLAWGGNSYGQLGDGTFSGPGTCAVFGACSATPIMVKLPEGARVTAVAAGYDYSLALTSAGRVLAWGSNRFGQLGDGTFTGPGRCAVFGACSARPIMVKLPRGTRVTAVAAGNVHSQALTSSGQVLAWGSNEDGELGAGTFAGLGGCACSTTPVKVKLPGRAKAIAVAAGNVYSLAIVHRA